LIKRTAALLTFCLLASASAQEKSAEADTIPFSQIGVAPGDTVPDFKATDENAGTVSYSSLRGKKKLVLAFFRGYW
jgi:hypothetical protein